MYHVRNQFFCVAPLAQPKTSNVLYLFRHFSCFLFVSSQQLKAKDFSKKLTIGFDAYRKYFHLPTKLTSLGIEAYFIFSHVF